MVSKRCIRITTASIVLYYILFAIGLVILANDALYNTFLMIVGYNVIVFNLLIICAMLFTLSGSIGLSAVMSKNECLALLFGYITLNLMVLFTCLGIGLIIFKSIYYFLINIGSIVSDLENACTEDESWVSEIDAIYELGDTIMCSSLCPCTAT